MTGFRTIRLRECASRPAGPVWSSRVRQRARHHLEPGPRFSISGIEAMKQITKIARITGLPRPALHRLLRNRSRRMDGNWARSGLGGKWWSRSGCQTQAVRGNHRWSGTQRMHHLVESQRTRCMALLTVRSNALAEAASKWSARLCTFRLDLLGLTGKIVPSELRQKVYLHARQAIRHQRSAGSARSRFGWRAGGRGSSASASNVRIVAASCKTDGSSHPVRFSLL